MAARAGGITAAQAAVAWVASRGGDVVPLLGCRTPARLAEALASPLRLSPEAMSAIEGAVPRGAVRGGREMTAGAT